MPSKVEEFKYHSDGTTMWDILFVIVPSFLEMFIAVIVSSTVYSIQNNILRFINDFLIIVIPTVLKVTVLADYAYVYLMVMLIIALLMARSMSTKILSKRKFEDSKQTTSYKPYITNARSIISNIVAVAILAVDFEIFPRRFAKTETFGYSLMDVGVGLYVYANGIVAPEIKETKMPTFLKSLKSTIPLVILGSGRFLILKEIDYYVPISEYGLHWNFFITLATTKILSSLILCFCKPKHSLYISLFVFLVHEISLTSGLAEWVLSDVPRDSFLRANREGISSCLGYVGLYFLSVAFGKLMHNSKQNSRLLSKLMLSSLILLTSTLYCEQTLGISRRLANTGYCLWICFIGIFMTGLLLGVEMLLKRIYNGLSRKNTPNFFSPLIFEAINYNGLAFFLLANLLTGAVNILMKPQTQSPLTSQVILVGYMLVLHMIITYMYLMKIKINIS